MHEVPMKFMWLPVDVDEQKQHHVTERLRVHPYATENSYFLSNVVSGDESWIHTFYLEMRQHLLHFSP